MSNPWNPQDPSSGDPDQPSTPPQEPQQQPPNQAGWGAPFASGAEWPGNQATTQTPTYEPQASGGATGNLPPNDFVFMDTPSSSGSNGSNGAKRVLAGVVVVLLMLGSGATGALLVDNNDNNGNTVASRTTNTVQNASAEPAAQPLAKVAEAVQPSVVSIEVSRNGQALDTGSGFILHDDGTIVTNNHVIAAAANSAGGSISVKFANGDTADATILGRDPSTDIAVIKVTHPNLVAASLGSTSSLHVGDSVLALGSPLGLEGSVASGIVSALHRTVELGGDEQNTDPFGRQSQQTQQSSTVADAIQTDAAINPGNSGGPLVDINGKVVGINTAIASLGGSSTQQSGSIGVGFAIPIDEVQSVAEQLIRGETPKHALLGVQITDDETGALIQSVTSGGAAAKAGLQEGDIVTKFGDKKITTADTLSAAVRTKNPGDKVTITYTRKGSTKTTDVTLGSSTD